MDRYNLIPEKLLELAVSLEQFGLNEYAWKGSDIYKVIQVLENAHISILGGDVYQLVDNTIFQTLDSWYINKSHNDNFYLRSCETAREFIRSYELANRGNYLYSIVFCDVCTDIFGYEKKYE